MFEAFIYPRVVPFGGSGGGSGVCDVPLNTPGILSGAGALAGNLNGQTFYFSPGGATTNRYGATTEAASPYVINWQTKRAIEFRGYSKNFGIVETGIAAPNFSKGVNLLYEHNTNNEWQITYGGSVQKIIPGDPWQIPAITINSNGDLEFYLDGVLEDTDSASFSGGESFIIYIGFNIGNDNIDATSFAQKTIISAVNQFFSTYGGANNICGDAISLP